MHDMEGLVDLLEWEGEGDVYACEKNGRIVLQPKWSAQRHTLIDFEVATEVLLDDAGQLRAALHAAEGRSFPDAALL